MRRWRDTGRRKTTPRHEKVEVESKMPAIDMIPTGSGGGREERCAVDASVVVVSGEEVDTWQVFVVRHTRDKVVLSGFPW